jgi:hypothetical protein
MWQDIHILEGHPEDGDGKVLQNTGIYHLTTWYHKLDDEQNLAKYKLDLVEVKGQGCL